MRRAGRIIYNGAMVVSLVLCLLTVGVWGRSYWVSDGLHWFAGDRAMFHDYELHTGRGGLQAAFLAYQNSSSELSAARFDYFRGKASEYPVFAVTYCGGLNGLKFQRFNAIGFEFVRNFDGIPVDLMTLTIPLYFVTLVFAPLPAHYFLRVRRRRRIAARLVRGCCVFCGYDLRASAGRCPECGRESSLAGRPKAQAESSANAREEREQKKTDSPQRRRGRGEEFMD